jgi:hypothetical protein
MIHAERTDKMLAMRDVREQLQLSTAEVVNLVRTGRLRAYKYAGYGPITRGQVGYQTTGLRFRTSDIEEMLERARIK